MFSASMGPPPGTVVRFADVSKRVRTAVVIGGSIEDSIFVVPLRSKPGLKSVAIAGERLGLTGPVPWHTAPALMRAIPLVAVDEVGKVAVTAEELDLVRAEVRDFLNVC